MVPGCKQRLELREGRVNLPGHGALLGFFLDHLARELLEIAQHRRRVLDDLDLALELGPEPIERDGILNVEVGETVDLNGGGGMVEDVS